jgi:hypothetical protein
VSVETKGQSRQWTYTHSHQTSRKSLDKRCLPESRWKATVFWERKWVLMVEFLLQGTTITSEVYCETPKNTQDHSGQKCVECWHTVLRSSMTMRVRKQLRALEHYWSISTGSSLTTLLRSPISLRATTTCLPIWRNAWVHSTSTIRGGVGGRCQNVAELTGGRLLWHRLTKTYSPIRKVPQFVGWLRWEVA